MMMMMALTGCTSIIEMTSDEEELIAEYAADSVIEHYHSVREQQRNKYKVHPVEEVKPTQETSAPKETQPAATDSSSAVESTTESDEPGTVPGMVDDTNPEYSIEALEKALALEGVELSMLGYTVEERYPNDPYALAVDATAGYKLLVVEYDVWNSTDASSIMKVDASKAIIKAVVNGSDQISLFKTMLKQDIMNMNDVEFAAGEAKSGVLIFRIPEALVDHISSIQVQAKEK